jgi:hypothetical protein
MLREMTAVELVEWRAFAALEPFGDAQQDVRMGRLMALLANINRDPRRRPTPYQPEEFLPDRTLTPAEAQAREEAAGPSRLLAAVEALNASLGGADLRGEQGGRDA